MTALRTCAMALRTATIVQGFGSHGCPHCSKNARLSADKVSRMVENLSCLYPIEVA